MPHGFLLTRVLLQWPSQLADRLEDLSAVTRTPDGSLWVGSDEHQTLERLTLLGDSQYGNPRSFHLQDFIDLADQDSEIDIEGLDYSDGYLWVVGSHSLKRKKPKGKTSKKAIERLSEIKQDPNRYLLARLPVLQGEIVSTYSQSNESDTLTAACLQQGPQSLIDTLRADIHLGPFLSIGLPSKDNGFDIEGLAVKGHRVVLGLRGPVLGGWAMLVDIEVKSTTPGVLELQDGTGSLYRKHFLDLNGLGIRDLCWHHDDLLILAGPTMALDGPMQLFRLKMMSETLDQTTDTLWDQESDALTVVFDLPATPGADYAEGLALYPCLGFDDALMVIYDSPASSRRPTQQTLFADVFQLPLD